MVPATRTGIAVHQSLRILRRALVAVVATVLPVLVVAAAPAVAGVPPAPTPLAPANGAQVIVPMTLSWSAVTDPTGIIGYNWQISPSSTFSPVVRLDSTNGDVTQELVSGLANGTYFWRVQAA